MAEAKRNYYVRTPSGSVTVAADRGTRDGLGFLSFKVGNEVVAEFAPGGWSSYTFSERAAPDEA
jgi:hypothetical protein